jgi:hypothetical protein
VVVVDDSVVVGDVDVVVDDGTVVDGVMVGSPPVESSMRP